MARGKLNQQAASVLNIVDYDENNLPIGMTEDRSNVLSANFGTPRYPRRGGCYKGTGIDGTNYVIIENIGSETITEYGFSAWLEKTNTTTEQAFIGNGNAFKIRRVNLNLRVFGLGVNVTSSNFFTLDDNRYYHIVVNIHSSGVDFYRDGKFVETIIVSPVFQALVDDRIGFGGTSNDDRFRPDGGFFDFYFFKRVITNNEVESIYNFKNVSGAFCWYKGDENSGTVAYDSSGNGNHGTITNAVTVPPEVNPNSIHQYQDIKSWHNDEGYSVDNTGAYPVFIPKDRSIQLPPFKDVLGNDLQYVGKVPGKAKFVDSSCFIGGTSSLSRISPTFISTKPNIQLTGIIDGTFLGEVFSRYKPSSANYFRILRSDSTSMQCIVISQSIQTLSMSITVGVVDKVDFELKIYGNNVYFTANGQTVSDTTTMTTGLRLTGGTANLTIGNNDDGTSAYEGKCYNFQLNELDSSGNFVQTLGHWPLCEPIKDAANHTYYDISGNGNHATLINGSTANGGKQDEYHWLQKYGWTVGTGSNGAPVGHIIPAKFDGTSDAVGNPLDIVQDGYSFLDSGCKLEQYSYPAIQDSFWRDLGTGAMLQKQFSDFTGVESGDTVFNDISEPYRVKQTRTHSTALTGKQLLTEKRITNNI